MLPYQVKQWYMWNSLAFFSTNVLECAVSKTHCYDTSESTSLYNKDKRPNGLVYSDWVIHESINSPNARYE